MFSSGKHLAEVDKHTDEAILSPVTTLSPQDTQWIHVEKQQRTSNIQVSFLSYKEALIHTFILLLINF